MSCHNDNKKGNESAHKHSPLRHVLHMVLCCGLPIVIVLFLPIIARVSPGASGVIGRIVPFICPLMMILMIPMMIGNSKKSSCCDNKNHEKDELVEPKKYIE